ncbi:MAG TPA: diphthine--ammonia ligase [Agriterribacter sp.]|nr:diphthine--ammonia ligase [Agriterribacter sp.]
MNIYLNWSGGKDAALALYKAKQQQLYVNALLTSMSSEHNRISMHGVRRTLLQAQAQSIALPLHTVELPENPGMHNYETAMAQKVTELKAEGFTHAMFGDIFLEDLKAYRESKLQQLDITCIFPLWKTETKELMREFIATGFKAIAVCVNEAFLDKSFCGRVIDQSFINDLPTGVDVCGENGEYHSFVFDGPIFNKPVCFRKGEIVSKQYPAPVRNAVVPKPYTFYFCDLLPDNG